MSFSELADDILRTQFVDYYGQVLRLRRDSVRVFLPHVKVGSILHAETATGPVPLEVVSLDPEGHVAMPLDDLGNVQLGDGVRLVEERSSIRVGPELLGQVVDSLCHSYESGPLTLNERVPLYGADLNPMSRKLISEPLDLGIRAINGCLTCGKGQRQGIFAGSGVGKSVLIGMMARFTEADVVVIGLIGERGREVREFIERELGEAGRKKSVVVVETADKSPVRRVRGAFVATAVAEYFRNQGAHVLLLVDSLTRFAMAQREIGMAAGEPPTSKGYTPSVFNLLSKLVERAGNWGEDGTITGLYTVLVEGDDLEDPIADASRAILDGHIVLARKLANKGHYPAVDLLASVSRIMDQVVSKEQMAAARNLKECLGIFQENEDAIHYGMYIRGSDAAIDRSIELEPMIRKFAQQSRDERVTFAESHTGLEAMVSPKGGN